MYAIFVKSLKNIDHWISWKADVKGGTEDSLKV